MALRITLPLGKKDNVKNLVFSILTKEYPLKIIELVNFIRKRYGKDVTFQAVRKGVLQLVEEGVLKREENEFSINKEWVVQSKKEIDKLYLTLNRRKVKPCGLQSIKGEVSVFTFNSLNEMMKFWEDIIEDWFENFKKGDLNVNCFQGAHGWEGLLYADREKQLMGKLKKKKIKTYALGMTNTSLDRFIWKFYKSIGLNVGVKASSSSFDKSYYVATYGKTIVQAQYPQKLVKELDDLFKKGVKSLNLRDLSNIVNRKIKIDLTVIKNENMAKQINRSIIGQIKESNL
ncbi:hypothetical protein HOD38_05185 [archaeon]|jgi:hypothetical protein|nr:hypothetical protein [archaeon]MBT4397633.1 hypothetical protein [archaeon]MBT4441678.1 hypothetical protein [archaeon]